MTRAWYAERPYKVEIVEHGGNIDAPTGASEIGADVTEHIATPLQEAKLRQGGHMVADWRAEEQVLLCLAQQALPQPTTASVMRIVERDSAERGYYAHALTIREARFYLRSALLALLVRLMALLGLLLACVIRVICLRVTVVWWLAR